MDHIQLLHGNKKLIVSVILDFKIVSDEPLGFQLFDAKKHTDSVIHMNDVIAFLQLREAVDLGKPFALVDLFLLLPFGFPEDFLV